MLRTFCFAAKFVPAIVGNRRAENELARNGGIPVAHGALGWVMPLPAPTAGRPNRR